MEKTTSIQTFTNSEFGEIRVIMINAIPWFVGRDVAAALGYGKGKSLNNAVSKHVDNDDKGVTEMMTPPVENRILLSSTNPVFIASFFQASFPQLKSSSVG